MDAQVAGRSETYAYDRFDNLTTLGSRVVAVDPATNRLPVPFFYDASGNLTHGDGNSFAYDAMNMATSKIRDGQRQRFVYGPGNERIAVLEDNGNELWTVRDSSGRVRREYSRSSAGTWIASRDYLYADRLVAAHRFADGSARHYHSDHLGSPRLITDGKGTKVSAHTYLPFGEEIPEPSNATAEAERLKFTGHERDAPDLDYLHARFYGPKLGRFLQPDPARDGWSLYTYTENNPLNRIDPDGLEDEGPHKTFTAESSASGAGGRGAVLLRRRRAQRPRTVKISDLKEVEGGVGVIPAIARVVSSHGEDNGGSFGLERDVMIIFVVGEGQFLANSAGNFVELGNLFVVPENQIFQKGDLTPRIEFPRSLEEGQIMHALVGGPEIIIPIPGETLEDIVNRSPSGSCIIVATCRNFRGDR